MCTAPAEARDSICSLYAVLSPVLLVILFYFLGVSFAHGNLKRGGLQQQQQKRLRLRLHFGSPVERASLCASFTRRLELSQINIHIQWNPYTHTYSAASMDCHCLLWGFKQMPRKYLRSMFWHLLFALIKPTIFVSCFDNLFLFLPNGISLRNALEKANQRCVLISQNWIKLFK